KRNHGEAVKERESNNETSNRTNNRINNRISNETRAILEEI
ncbi:MAG: hypothetical protein H6Q59_3208, partial [Firmicutes bacterium]|nr:hypothetical protein [Bacillota bacterium]